ncbi:MAG: hypothetical protein RIG62_21860 [Cyclobacteriaceae bacterium]
MKTYTLITCIAAALLLAGCSVEDVPGPQGPQGPQGPEGPPGPQTIASIYEYNFNLNADNDWQTVFTFPAADEIYQEDVVLVYLLWEQVELDNGEFQDVWQLMPVSFFTDAGLLQISYDFTVNDVKIFAAAGFTLDPARDTYTDEWARIVVVPADFSPNARIDINYEDYYEVQEAFDLPEIKGHQRQPFRRPVQSGS